MNMLLMIIVRCCGGKLRVVRVRHCVSICLVNLFLPRIKHKYTLNVRRTRSRLRSIPSPLTGAQKRNSYIRVYIKIDYTNWIAHKRAQNPRACCVAVCVFVCVLGTCVWWLPVFSWTKMTTTTTETTVTTVLGCRRQLKRSCSNYT